MAELFPDEGLDFILDVFPRVVRPRPSVLYVGLYSSQTPETVPERDAVLAEGVGVVEVEGPGYERIPILGEDWQDPVEAGPGRRLETEYPGFAFPVSAGAWTTINGFFIATEPTAGIALYYANFDQEEAIEVNAAGYTVRVPPFWQANG